MLAISIRWKWALEVYYYLIVNFFGNQNCTMHSNEYFYLLCQDHIKLLIFIQQAKNISILWVCIYKYMIYGKQVPESKNVIECARSTAVWSYFEWEWL